MAIPGRPQKFIRYLPERSPLRGQATPVWGRRKVFNSVPTRCAPPRSCSGENAAARRAALSGCLRCRVTSEESIFSSADRHTPPLCHHRLLACKCKNVIVTFSLLALITPLIVVGNLVTETHWRDDFGKTAAEIKRRSRRHQPDCTGMRKCRQ